MKHQRMELLEKPINLLIAEQPHILDFLNDNGIQPTDKNQSLGYYLENLSEDFFEDIGMDKKLFMHNMVDFIEKNEKSSEIQNKYKIDSITIIGGYDKNKNPEDVHLTLNSGSITSIVGPTGSGKSRLLADIEWMAQGDTPTGRTILINKVIPDSNLRFSMEHKLVAQLSQNMNFVMDTSVGEFLNMHAESRLLKETEKIVTYIIAQANLLAGESFTAQTPITALSGGQSRALMIADTAILSTSPVVLIDEIENAGIDRKKALQLLVKKEKIVLIATHDPILALLGSKRLVIKNGSIQKVVQTSELEKRNLAILETIDSKMLILRNQLRNGESINNIEFKNED